MYVVGFNTHFDSKQIVSIETYEFQGIQHSSTSKHEIYRSKKSVTRNFRIGTLMISNEEDFFKVCAEIIGIPVPQYNPLTGPIVKGAAGEIYSKPMKTRRWDRSIANGRFEGYGLIRYFSNDLIYLMLKNPSFTKICKSQAEVISELKRIFKHE